MSNIAQLRRLGLFDAKVPRYTSYPPATRFSDSITNHDFLNWLGALPVDQPISLYLHVPFCRRLCWFCACRTQGVNGDAPVLAYLASLKAEMATLAAALPKGIRVGRMHWGGGTPTLLAPGMIEDLMDALQGSFQFDDEMEFSVEIDPNEFDAPRLEVLARAGMTRASIGVQDFHPDIQEVIGRRQSYEITADAVVALRDAGVASLNTDILFGLPHQSEARISETVQMLLSLSPDRVALYGYAHVPWMARRQGMIPTEALPSPEKRLALFEAARKLFVWDGYAEIGIDHFARPGDGLERAAATGRLRRNFQGYTDDTCTALIGLGASSISRLPQGYAQNAARTADYQRSVRNGDLAIVRGHRFTGQDLLRSRLIEALMCDFRIETAEMARDFQVDVSELDQMFRRAAASFPDLVRQNANGLEIKPEGRAMTRMVARIFDEYDMNPKGHSTAI